MKACALAGVSPHSAVRTWPGFQIKWTQPDFWWFLSCGPYLQLRIAVYQESKRKNMKYCPKCPSNFSYCHYWRPRHPVFHTSFHVHILYDILHIFGKPCSLEMRFNHKNAGKRIKCWLKCLPKSTSFAPCGRLSQSILPLCHLLSKCSANLYVFWNLLTQTRRLGHLMIRKIMKYWKKMLQNFYSSLFKVLPLHSRNSWWCAWTFIKKKKKAENLSPALLQGWHSWSHPEDVAKVLCFGTWTDVPLQLQGFPGHHHHDSIDTLLLKP